MFDKAFDGQFRGTAAVAGLVHHHGVWDGAVHLHSLPGDWTLIDRQWDLG